MKGIQCENFTKKCKFVAPLTDATPRIAVSVGGHTYATGSCVLSYFGILSYVKH